LDCAVICEAHFFPWSGQEIECAARYQDATNGAFDKNIATTREKPGLDL